jgi:anti-anti-sigma regulatory factor
MSQKFHAAVHQRDDVCYVKLSGVIDEDNELVELTEKIPGGGTVVIDLGEVERINSCGVRDWVNWLSSVEAKPAEVVLVECSPAIVAQINLVNNFTGNGVVKSFYIPYFCPECDGEKVLLAEAVDMGPPPHEPPTCRCDECDQPMDFDDMPDSYFAFLSSQKTIAKAEKVQGVLNEFQQGSDLGGEKSRIRSRVGSASGAGSMPQPSLPSVPSLPSISRTGLGLPQASGGSNPGTGPIGVRPPTFAGLGSDAPAVNLRGGSGKGGTVIYVLVGVLLAAISVLAYLLISS